MTKVTIHCDGWDQQQQMKMVHTANEILKSGNNSYMYPGEYLVRESWDFQVFQDTDLLELMTELCRKFGYIHTSKVNLDEKRKETRYIWYFKEIK